MEGVVRAKRRYYIPVVLSREEVDQVLRRLSAPYDLVGELLYGCGLRLLECLKPGVQDLNFDMKILTVDDGKGKKSHCASAGGSVFKTEKPVVECEARPQHHEAAMVK